MNNINRARELLFNSSLEHMELNQHLIPYCIRWLDNDRAVFLNRNYLPLGIKPSSEFCDYEQYPTIPSSAVPGLTHEDYSYYIFDRNQLPWYGLVDAHNALSRLDDIAANYALLELGDNHGKSH